MVQDPELDKCSCRRSGIIPTLSFILLTILLTAYNVLYIYKCFFVFRRFPMCLLSYMVIKLMSIL